MRRFLIALLLLIAAAALGRPEAALAQTATPTNVPSGYLTYCEAINGGSLNGAWSTLSGLSFTPSGALTGSDGNPAGAINRTSTTAAGLRISFPADVRIAFVGFDYKAPSAAGGANIRLWNSSGTQIDNKTPSVTFDSTWRSTNYWYAAIGGDVVHVRDVEAWIANGNSNNSLTLIDNICVVYQSEAPTATPTATYTPSNTPTITLTPTPTYTPSNTPTITLTPTPTYTPTFTFTPSNTPTNTYTPTNTSTPTLTFTPTFTPTNTLTPTPSITPSASPSPTYALITPAVTPTLTHTLSPTPTRTPTRTPTGTITPSRTPTRVPSSTPGTTATLTPSYTPSVTLTPSRTFTPRPPTGTPVPLYTWTPPGPGTPFYPLPTFQVISPGGPVPPTGGPGPGGNWCIIRTDDSVPGISALQQVNFLPFLVCFAQTVVLDYTYIYTNFDTVINILYAILIIAVVFIGMGRILGIAPRIGTEAALIASTRGGRLFEYFNRR